MNPADTHPAPPTCTGLCKFCGEIIQPAALNRMPISPAASPIERMTAAYGFAVAEHLMKHHKEHAQVIHQAMARLNGLLCVLCTEWKNTEIDREVEQARAAIQAALEGPKPFNPGKAQPLIH